MASNAAPPAGLIESLRAHGQEHVLAFWDRLAPSERALLTEQLERVDLALIERLFRGGESQTDWQSLAARAESPPAFRLDPRDNHFSREEATREGARALAEGKVGAILVAGGQGTRLGFDHPKGMYALGPVSGASLFQILLEKAVAISRRAGARVPVYLMTSPATHDETVAYLAERIRFGLPAEDLFVFCQGTMPAVDAQTGKLLLDSPESLALSPDGHGGMLAALAASGGLADAEQRGVEQLFYFQVDNPLTRVCDAEFLGYHLLSQSEHSTQVVAKRDPLERVGVAASIDGAVRIIEYSDLPDEAARRRNADGSLHLWAGSTAIHVFDTAFLRRMAGQAGALPFHVARKCVQFVDAEGHRVEPDKPNALKFERFIFDLLPSAKNAIVMEIDPAEGFAPVKNGPGAKSDSPETAQAAMLALHRKWLDAAGAVVATGARVELSPLFALDASDVKQRVSRGTRFEQDVYLTSPRASGGLG